MNKVDLLDRSESVITRKKDLKELHVLKDFPVFFGCVDSDPDNDLYADMHWAIDKETGIVQLSKVLPLDILYQAQHVDAYGPTWHKYYDDFSNYICKHALKNILEIGGGSGKLAEMTIEKSNDLDWTIVEPNPTFEETQNIHTIHGFVDENFKYDKLVDTVVFSQVLEHAYDPIYFLKSIYNVLPTNGKLIFAYPNLELWIKKFYTNTINFEHTMLLTDYFVDYLLQLLNFEIIDKTTYEEHSIFYTVKKTQKNNIAKFLYNKYSEYKKMFNDFVDYHVNIVKEINEKIEKHNGPIYLFGAHIFSQYLLCFGLKQDKILCILDNSLNKQGKRLYGTKFYVESPKILKDKENAAVILKASIYNEEIKKDILENINSNVIFW